MGLTTDPSDPRLTHGVDADPVGQAEVYLVLSEEERAEGFVRPVRRTYVHEVMADGSNIPKVQTSRKGMLIGPCGGVATTMGRALAETYARNPHFYGATYCVGCQKHLPVGANGEFSWEDGTRVGT